jgi:hypothetical protein
MTDPYLPASKRLTREQFLRVIQLADDFEMEAARCADAGAFHAAGLMVSCALEAMLLANVLAFEPDMERDGIWPAGKRPPEEWHLPELVKFHLDHGWIADDDPAQQLGEAVEAMNELRNVIAHPGRLIRDALGSEFDERVFAGMFGVLHATFEETRKRLYGDGGERFDTGAGAVDHPIGGRDP